MKCDFCHQTKSDVTVRQDPFAYEVCDEDDYLPMCDDCEQNRSADV